MENNLIMLANITLAVKARDVLSNSGIHSYVQKTPKMNNAGTCGYSVFVPNRTDEAENILKDRGFNILGRTGRAGV